MQTELAGEVGGALAGAGLFLPQFLPPRRVALAGRPLIRSHRSAADCAEAAR